MLRAFQIALSVMSPLSPPITSESYFRTLFEASGEAFFVVNEQGQAIDCNDAVLSLHGCQRSDILGTTPLDWSPEFQPNGRRSDEWAAEILSRATAGETVRFEWENRRLDRTPFFVSSTVHRAVIDGLVCYLVVSRDITERRRLEQQLVESEERFRALFEQAPLPYQSLDMGGNIREVNDAWLRLTGETERTVLRLAYLLRRSTRQHKPCAVRAINHSGRSLLSFQEDRSAHLLFYDATQKV